MSYTPHRHNGIFPKAIKKEKDAYEAQCKEVDNFFRAYHAQQVREVAKSRFVRKSDVQGYINVFKEIRHLVGK